MSEATANADRRCFVCGPDNPIGLHIHFRLEGDSCRGEFTPGPDHVGYDQVVHGGILFSALDDVMANWFYLQGARGFTARCEMRFRQAAEVGQPLQLVSRMLKRKGRVMVLQAEARDAASGAVLVECEASFMLSEPGPFARGPLVDGQGQA